jgi:WS/DGAT/MGAT family acyltransferase
MARYSFERLSAQDNGFLLWETPSIHMHIASTQLFEAGPLRTAEGGIDIDAIKRTLASRLHRIPRYRQKLAWIPLENHAVWVDDAHFNLDYHIRHLGLPKPGSEKQLKRLSARVMAQQLDRSKPLWETWVVEGLEGDRFAFISKIHHCMMDGRSGMDLGEILLSSAPEFETDEPPIFIPRPRPTPAELWRDAQKRRLSLPCELLRGFRELGKETEGLRAEVTVRLQALRGLAGWSARPPSETPINQRVGPHRAFDWLTLSLADMKAVRKGLDCTINDVVLTTVTGAMREFMLRRQVRPEGLDFRVQAPVSVRREEAHGRLGNQVSGWLIRLPLAESDSKKQLAEIRETTRKAKESKQALGIEMMVAVAEWTTSSLLSLASQAASGAMNTIVTNVPGPQMPLYMVGAKQLAMFPQVPLMKGIGLGIALVSYNGLVCWGFNADYEMVPDLPVFPELIQASFERLAEAAGVELGGGKVLDLPAREAAKPGVA